MERSCPSCQQLNTLVTPHPELVTLSKQLNSELFKCRSCNSFLMLDQNGWEILSAGEYQDVYPGSRARYTA
ncbi:MAG: hypothetical protein HWE39_14860 [Oceanospirillaceae bacterium]|nr:hypothetical protein [Oceanospirillaceae bacterium]